MTQADINNVINGMINDPSIMGQHIAFANGSYKGQCTVVPYEFVRRLTGLPNPGFANDRADGWGIDPPASFAPFLDTQPFQSGRAYPEGTILIWNSPHIAVVVSHDGTNIVKVLEQNADPDGNPVQVVNRVINNQYHQATYAMVPILQTQTCTYEDCAPHTMYAKLQPTNWWNLNGDTINDFVPAATLSLDEPFPIGGYAHHKIGYTYAMTAGDYARAKAGDYSTNNGVNILDLKDAPTPAPAVVAPVPDVVPVPTPPAAPGHPYTIEDIPSVEMVLNKDSKLWNLDDTEWSQFANNPVEADPAGKPVIVVAKAHHILGSIYFMPDRNQPAGYNSADLDPYVAPQEPTPAVEVPVSTDPPFTVTYDLLPGEVTYTAKNQPTNAINFQHAIQEEINVDIVYQLNKGAPFIGVGKATHSLLGVFIMNKHDFAQANITGQPLRTVGIHVDDLFGTTTKVPDVTPVDAPAANRVVVMPQLVNKVSPAVTPSTDNWKETFKKDVKPLVSTVDMVVYDLEDETKRTKIAVGKLIPQAGTFWKDGKQYVQTIPSFFKGNYWSIPVKFTGEVKKAQQQKAVVLIENIWDKYSHEVEADLDEMFHSGMKFEDEIKKETAGDATKLKGREKYVDMAARILFGKNKNQKQE